MRNTEIEKQYYGNTVDQSPQIHIFQADQFKVSLALSILFPQNKKKLTSLTF